MTKQEVEALLEEVQKKLCDQNHIQDDRLLAKERQLIALLKEYDNV